MKIGIIIIFSAASALARGQAVPDATRPAGLPVIHGLRYSMRYSQSAYLFGSNSIGQKNQVTSIASGDLNYVRDHARFPLTMNYTAGYMSSIYGPSLGTGVFQHLSVQQGIVHPHWDLTASDDVSYTPQAPVIGFSGVPGTGEPVGGPGTGPPPQSILTLNTRTLSNLASLQFAYRQGHATILTVGGDSQLLDFPAGNGSDSEGLQANAGIDRRLSARTTLGVRYQFSNYSYGASPISGGKSGSFDTHTTSFGITHSWSRHLNTDAAIGPEWITASDASVVPLRQTITVNAGGSYNFRTESISARFSRGITGGQGYLPSASVDIVTGGLSRTFGMGLNVGAVGSYYHTGTLLKSTGSSDARFGGIEGSKQLGEFLSVSASYTAIDQTSTITAQTSVLNQFYQVVSFGVTYTPRGVRRGK